MNEWRHQMLPDKPEVINKPSKEKMPLRAKMTGAAVFTVLILAAAAANAVAYIMYGPTGK
ncbi:hypothetical protein A2701_03850 [Candidatus Amesbacteria bacterium RIFCSPHIGHO2_01_FULL_47_34]|uniref:Uncharacterized protein n=4 Tax=Candidatus Amesiibacteriota TaxID=1752730 RepID=A0A1F4Z1E9_9BACT|nr:MAG: hypothetical protein A2972_01105 [Candidatus Amesbacteria bacterium RIFCSPLOWO2_01_FULL_47_33]OGD00810.1 MAG: hypothetical protein A2701_03850 [Candidatus Amesbacteria bacterium RIFCSPHIGHO2_01_FULL_47_34]